MQNSNVLMANALFTLKSNIEKTGDPLGFSQPYWADWADGLSLPEKGHSMLVTARMYQMLPFVEQATKLTSSFRPLLPLLGSPACRSLAQFAYNAAGKKLIRSRAKKAVDLRQKGQRALQGIGEALSRTGEKPAYPYADDPYSGVLLHELGLEKDAVPHMKRVYQLLKSGGAKEVITTDPHTTFMLREIYPRHIEDFDLQVRHYLEILSSRLDQLPANSSGQLPETAVLHDSCVMTRDLGIIEQTRQVASQLGIKILEPENAGQNTACCGGPVEYAYADLSNQISDIRIQELAALSPNILVACPICLFNLIRYEKTYGVKIWDIGELLHMSYNSSSQ